MIHDGKWNMSRLSAFSILFFVSVLFAVGLLVFHNIPSDLPYTPCADNFRLYGRLGIVLNCDSPEFMRLALQPKEILEPKSSRQSRPGLILISAVLTRLLRPLSSLAVSFFSLQGRTLQDWTVAFIPAYIPYILLNFLVVSASLAIFVHELSRELPLSLPPLLTGVVLVANDLVKMFLLTPHTALLALLAPLFCVWSYRVAASNEKSQDLRLLLLAVAAGIGVTAWAAFAVFLPCVLIAGLIKLRAAPSRQHLGAFLIRAAFLLIAITLPMLLWILIVKSRTSSFYLFEIVEYGQGVWIFKALGQGLPVFLDRLIANVAAIITKDIPYLAFLVLYLATVTLLTRGPRDLHQTLTRVLAADSLVVASLFVVFFALVGITYDRVAFSAVPSLVLAAAAAQRNSHAHLPRATRLIATISAILLVSVFFVYELLKTGPFA
jgi:hypothetical protein